MNLVGALWIAVGVGALVFAGDAFLMKITGRRRGAVGPESRLVLFGIIMLLFGIASIILGLYETLHEASAGSASVSDMFPGIVG